MEIKRTPSFKAKTIIHSHNNLLSTEQIKYLVKLGDSIGNIEDSIYFNVRNFKKNRIIIAHESKLKSKKEEINSKSFLVGYKWLIKPEKYIKMVINNLKNLSF